MPEPLTYDDVGATRPEQRRWEPTPARYRRHEESVRLGSGDELWARATSDLMAWAIKRRSGFAVSQEVVQEGDAALRARVGPITVTEPVRVVAVVEEPDRVAFAYGTRPGHPVSGEEAFIVRRQGDDVHLVLRSLTASAPHGVWRLVYPLLLVAQMLYRRRYLRALRPQASR